MNYQYSKEKIWLEDEAGKTIAYVEFPEVEPGVVDVAHTVVDPVLRGKGIAAELMVETAKALQEDGRKARLSCSYAVKWFDKNREYEGILADPRQEYEKAQTMNGAACGIRRPGSN